MSELQVIAELKVHDGKLEEFKAVAEECVKAVREKDSGTFQYDWYFTADMTECTVIERYRDSEEVIEHITNLGDILGTSFGLADLTLHLYGDPSAELLAAADGLDVRVHGHFQSI